MRSRQTVPFVQIHVTIGQPRSFSRDSPFQIFMQLLFLVGWLVCLVLGFLCVFFLVWLFFFWGGGGVLLLLLLGGGGSGVLGFCLFVFVLVCFTCGLSLHVETLKKTLNCNVSKLTF